MGDIHENFDDNDSCNISNMSSASKENQRAETALSEVKSCSEPNNDNWNECEILKIKENNIIKFTDNIQYQIFL